MLLHAGKDAILFSNNGRSALSIIVQKSQFAKTSSSLENIDFLQVKLQGVLQIGQSDINPHWALQNDVKLGPRITDFEEDLIISLRTSWLLSILH